MSALNKITRLFGIFLAVTAAICIMLLVVTQAGYGAEDSDAPKFRAGSNTYSDLTQAVNYAKSNSISNVTVVEDGTLPAGEYTIPSGITLLIPFDDDHTVYTTEPDVVYGSHSTPQAYRTLKMSKGADITVERGGAISVPSKLSASGTGKGSWNGTPTGNHGRIDMEEGSSIDLENGADLYCYGYISGSGNVKAESGSTVWEAFQIRCWRGGTATLGSGVSAILNPMAAWKEKKVFPMSQYYVQNVEAPLTIYSGAVEKVYTSINMNNSAYSGSATFIGSGGLFQLSKGSLTKSYSGSDDRLIMASDGDVSISGISITASGISLSSEDYVLPFNNNMTLNVNSGTAVLSQDTALLPGSKLSVTEGAKVDIRSGKNVYVYDSDDWGQYAAEGASIVPVGYSTVNGTKTIRTGVSDAKFDINGTVDISGNLYTTAGGADIISSKKTGRVKFTAAPTAQTATYQATQSGRSVSYTGINANAAWLHNDITDPVYTQTKGCSAGTYYSYCRKEKKWHEGDPCKITYTPSWSWNNDYSKAEVTLTDESDETNTVTKNAEITEKTEDAGCETEGKKTYTAKVTYEGTTYTNTKTVTIPAAGHTYGDPAYVWGADNLSVIASRVCTKCGKTEMENADVTSEVTSAPKCETKGIRTFRAVFDNSAFKTQTKTEEIPATGHKWKFTGFNWSDDHERAAADYECEKDNSHVKSLSAAVSKMSSDANCTVAGTVTYTASISGDESADGTAHTSEPVVISGTALGHSLVKTEAKAATCKEEGNIAYWTCARCGTLFSDEEGTKEIQKSETVIPATGHTYGQPSWLWKVYDSATAEFTCVSGDDKKTVNAEISNSVTKEPTCTEEGTRTYTAKVEFEGKEYKDTKEESIHAKGHSWNKGTVTEAPKCTKKGTKTFTCLVCGKTKTEAMPALDHELSKSDAKGATCTENGNTAYWTCSKCGKIFSDEKATKEITKAETVIPATGHRYGNPVYTWSDDNATVTAEAVCENDSSHRATETAETVYRVTKEPTFTETGTGTYAATFKNDLFKAQTKNVTLAAKGYTYDLTDWKWSDDNSGAQAVFTRNDGETESVTADVSNSVTIKPTCTEEGTREYTAKVEFEGKEYKDTKKESIPAAGHSWDEGKTTTAATTVSEGVKTYTCTVCGKTKTEDIPKLKAVPSGKNDVRVSYEGAGDGDVKGAVFGRLTFRSNKQTRKTVRVSWKKISGAKKYIIYGNKCGKNNRMKVLKTFKSSSDPACTFKKIAGKKVKKGTYYKMMMAAYDGNGELISSSITIHVAAKGGKVCNYKSVRTKAKKNKVTLKHGKKFKLRARGIKSDKKLKVRVHRKTRYESSNRKIATVNAKGVIRGKKKGKCYVYAYTQNGVYKRIKVTVR